MFTFQAPTRKRDRDDSDSDSDLEEEQPKRYIKKTRSGFSGFAWGNLQCSPPSTLPYRPSLTPSPPGLVTDPEETTPAPSESGWPNSPGSIKDCPVFSASQSSCIDYSMEMDDDDADVRSQPPESPALSSFSSLFMRPAMLNASLFGSEPSNSGRIATPMHSTFKRGTMSGIGYPISGFAGCLSEENPSGSLSSIPEPPSRRSNRQGTGEDRSRRMPSPITEDEDIPDTPTTVTQSQLSRLSFSQPNDQMDTDLSTPVLAVLPTPRGRKRSGALTGMGRISMGYRDDCEKCRQRVPGHYSHFLP